MKGLYPFLKKPNRRQFYLAAFFALAVVPSFSQTITSAQNGPWDQGSTWVGGVVPNSGNSSLINVLHAVTVTTSITVDQVAVGTNASLTINSGGTVIVANGTGTDLDLFNDGLDYGYLTVNSGGILVANDLATIVGADQANTNFNSQGVYRHLYTTTEGAMPIANWAADSRIELNGYTGGIIASAGGNWDTQTFGDIYFNSTLSAGVFDFAGLLTNVGGELRIINTGSGRVQLSTTQIPTVNIGTDLSVLGTSRLVMATTGSGTVVNIGRDLIFSSTLAAGSNTNTSGATTVNVTRDFVMNASGGTFFLGTGTGAGSGTLNVGRDFTLTAGTLSETATAASSNIFFLTGSHTYANSGTINGQINFTVNNSAILNLGTSAIAGTGTFTLAASSVLQVGALDVGGAIQTGTSNGNIRNSGLRTYNSTSTIVYNGLGAQRLGNGFPSNVNLQISNAAGVTNNNVGVTNVVGNLTLTAGSFIIGASNTLNVQSNFITSAGTIGGDATANLTFSGAGSLGTLTFTSGSEFINNLTISRIVDLTLGSNLTVAGTLDLSGGSLDFSGKNLTLNGGSIIASGTGLKSSNTSILSFGGSTFSGIIPFSGSGNQLLNLTFATNGGAYTWNSTVTVNNQLTLTSGALTHTSGITMAANSTFIKGAGSITGSAPIAASSYNVTYNGTGNTGVELPTTLTALRNLTIASSGTITLNSNITINGDFTISGGTFAAGNRLIIMRGTTWSASGSAFSAGTSTVTFSGAGTTLSGSTTFNNLTVTGAGVLTLSSGITSIGAALLNNGTINAGTGTVDFTGTTTITGSNPASFYDVTVTGTLTAPSGSFNVAGDFTNNGTFAHNNGSIVFNGTSSILGSATTSLYNVTISGSLTAPSTTLNIAGNWATSGTFTNNGGKVVLNGTVALQTITGTININDIDISNSTGVSNNAAMNLSGVMTLVGSGAFDADGSGSGVLTVKSTAVNTGGRIAALPIPANFSGNVTVERFVNSNPLSWRYLSMPITNGNVGNWQSIFPVTGNFSNSSPIGVNNVTDSSAPSIYYYDAATQAYIAVGSGGTTGGTSLSNLVGYSPYPYLTGSFTVSVRGTLRTGSASIPVSSSYNLVPNPYPSPIDWDAVDRTGFSNTMSIRTANNVFASYVAGGAATNAPFVGWTGEVATGQSFWVQSTGATTLSLTESAKTGNQYQFIRQAAPQNLVRVILSSETQRDETVIWFPSGATDEFDDLYDASKMRNGYFEPGPSKLKYLNIASYSRDKEFAINGLASLNCNSNVKLRVTDVAPGKHTLGFSDLETLHLGYQVVLVDHYSKTEKIVSNELVYEFEVSDDLASLGDDRFELRFILPGSVYINSQNAPAIKSQELCDKQGIPISISAQRGAAYQFYINDVPVSENIASSTDGEILFEINRSKLVVGVNKLDVRISDSGGCTDFLFKEVVTVNNQPLVIPAIEKDGLKLSVNTSEGTTMQWFLNGAVIDKTNTSTVWAGASGFYSVQVSNGICTQMSKSIEVKLADGEILAYPVPTDDFVNVILPVEIAQSLKAITLFDSKGTMVFDHKSNPDILNGDVRILDLRNEKAGVYLLSIEAQKRYTIKIIKK